MPTAAMHPHPPLFVFRGLNKTYPDGSGQFVKVITGLNAEIPADGITALVGESGTGKTTLANLAAGLESDYVGEVFHLGWLLPKTEGSELRAHRRAVAYVGQQLNNVSHLTALNNVALSLACQGWKLRDARDAAAEALAAVGLSSLAGRKPAKLSGGQQQRVAIARALASGARTIIADEPSGNLDPKNRDQIMDCFRLCREKGRAVVMITHSPTLARRCDRVLMVTPKALVDVTGRLRSSDPNRNGGATDRRSRA